MRRVRSPDVTDELYLMAEDMHSNRQKPVIRRFHQLLDALEAVHARYAVIGAVAMGAHGAARYTHDIDVLVADEDLERVVAKLSRSMVEAGRGPAEGPAKQVRLRSKGAEDRARSTSSCSRRSTPSKRGRLPPRFCARSFDRKFDVASPEALIV